MLFWWPVTRCPGHGLQPRIRPSNSLQHTVLSPTAREVLHKNFSVAKMVRGEGGRGRGGVETERS